VGCGGGGCLGSSPVVALVVAMVVGHYLASGASMKNVRIHDSPNYPRPGIHPGKYQG
jgi:hypothetical protein